MTPPPPSRNETKFHCGCSVAVGILFARDRVDRVRYGISVSVISVLCGIYLVLIESRSDLQSM